MQDDKYVVFKRQDWERYTQRRDIGTPDYLKPVPDAVVIRCQDVFAPPALDAYGNAILCVIEAHHSVPALVDNNINRLKQLQDIADYFHRRATEAWQMHRKLPD